MINELTPKEGERVALNAYRHAWSIVANIFVYAVTWLLLGHNQTNDNTQMNADVFQVNSIEMISTLDSFSCFSDSNAYYCYNWFIYIFDFSSRFERIIVAYKYICFYERISRDDLMLFLEHYKTLPNLFRSWRDFLCDIQFYLVAILWMLTRVISNVSQVYLPLYIMDATDASQVDRVSFLHQRIFLAFICL